ncbi:MAG: 50S ribosomal protein L24 [Clostridiales bacterium]|jgi:large subunit ribosomal protein L24|nr:50S ribosomal protein L24 [Clostridiales bacterium]
MSNKVHVKTGDTVIVINGKDRGKTGKVMAVSPAEGKVIVEGVNVVTKHVKPRKMGEPGGLIKAEAALYANKVQLVCPKCGQPTRVGHAIDSKGKKVRVCKKSGCAAQFE